jgi:hypothetical protein
MFSDHHIVASYMLMKPSCTRMKTHYFSTTSSHLITSLFLSFTEKQIFQIIAQSSHSLSQHLIPGRLGYIICLHHNTHTGVTLSSSHLVFAVQQLQHKLPQLSI